MLGQYRSVKPILRSAEVVSKIFRTFKFAVVWSGSSMLAMTFTVSTQHRQVHVSIVRPHFTKSRRCDIRASMTALCRSGTFEAWRPIQLSRTAGNGLLRGKGCRRFPVCMSRDRNIRSRISQEGHSFSIGCPVLACAVCPMSVHPSTDCGLGSPWASGTCDYA